MSRMDQMGGEQTTGQERGNPGIGENLRDTASQVGQQVRDAAREQYGHLRDQASEYYERGRDMAQQWEQNLEGYIQEQPIKSILIAAGVGLLLGVLLKRH
jgi:ElaB/YqjD/DUF883 family membrane-anchored ribosome-binding protein